MDRLITQQDVGVSLDVLTLCQIFILITVVSLYTANLCCTRHTKPFSDNGIVTLIFFSWQILVWDTRRAALMQTIDLHTDVIYSLSMNRDGSRMVTTSRDKRLRIIDPLTGKLLQVWVSSLVFLLVLYFAKW